MLSVIKFICLNQRYFAVKCVAKHFGYIQSDYIVEFGFEYTSVQELAVCIIEIFGHVTFVGNCEVLDK